VTLSAEDIESIATRVVELLNGAPASTPTRLADAAEVARELGVDRDWVYAHARELGAARLGGDRGRLRFDLARIRRDLDKPAAVGARSNARATRRRAPTWTRGNVELLPYLEVRSSRQVGGRAARKRPRPDNGR